MILAALLMLQVGGPATAPECSPMRGGPSDGMCVGSVISSDANFEVVSLRPAPGRGQPISAEITPVLTGLLQSYRAHTTIDPASFAANGVMTFCPKLSEPCSQSWPMKAWPLDPDFTPSHPFKITDGRIRIEWSRNGRIEYLSLLKFEGSKIANIWILPAFMGVERRK